MEVRISDGERVRYTEIYGTDPLARDGWVTLRLKHQLGLLGCQLAEELDLLDVPEDEAVVASMTRGNASAQITRRRERDASVFSVIVRWS